MAEWGSGYVTDTAYVHDFCRVQTPAILSLAALSKGVAIAGGRGEPLAYCDLGCGQGFTANLVAAANPQAEVFAVDFNPAHIAGARALASAAGVKNVEFREAGFDELLQDAAVPDFDIMCLHGVYSWISPANRQAVVALVRRRLKSGGLFYISYDAMPGWAAIAPLRRLLVQQYVSSGQTSSETALARGLAFADRLKELGALFYRAYPHVAAQLDRLRRLPASYLAHELLTRDWQAFSFADVSTDLTAAKLTYVGSAHLTDHVDRVNFTEEQQHFLRDIADPLLDETTRDMIVNRQFRRDVFVKGARPLNAAEARERWLDTRFALSAPLAEIDMTFETALGKLQVRPDMYRPMIEILDRGPLTLRDLIANPAGAKLEWAGLLDAIKVLVGHGELQPALPAESDAARAPSVRAFNAAVMARAKETAELGYLASPVTGGGVRVDRFAQLYLAAKQEGSGDPVAALAAIAEQRGGILDKDDNRLGPQEARTALAAKATQIEQRSVPLLARLGIC
jgi:SAM-dependent methyltransferase